MPTVPRPEPALRNSRQILLTGLALSVVAAALAGVLGGWREGRSGLLFGLLATAIQLVAGRWMTGVERAPIQQYMKRWGGGMALRLLGVGLVGLVIWLEPPALPALPAALGYVGVLIPLLFLEARRI
jgi:hypothetical protein